MNYILPVHVLGGALAIIAGFIPLFVVKGARLHRRSGIVAAAPEAA